MEQMPRVYSTVENTSAGENESLPRDFSSSSFDFRGARRRCYESPRNPCVTTLAIFSAQVIFLP